MIPKPNGHYILIKLEEVESKSKGGIVLLDDTVDKEQRAEQIGRVLEIGPTAYHGWQGCDHETKKPHECWGTLVGNLVECRKYEGMQSAVPGYETYRYVPDTHVVGTIEESDDE